MKTYKSIIIQMVFLLLLSHVSFSQEVEVNLGGNSTSDAFVVKDTSGNVLLKMDGDQNFGINSDQPDGIEIKGRSNTNEQQDGDQIMISGGSAYRNGGSVSILGGHAYETGGSINISSGSGPSSGNIDIITGEGDNGSGNIKISTDGAQWAGNIAITTGNSNVTGGSITIATGYANGGGNDIVLSTADSESGNHIELNVGGGDAGDAIILRPNGGKVEIIGSGTYTGTWTQASDERYKSNIKPLLSISNKVNLLQPIEYEWNKEEYPENNFPDGNQIGLIAQEVEKLFPEIVATNQDGYKSIDYSKISVLLLQAVKEQQNEIEKQSDEIEKQSDEIDKMKSDIEELKSKIMRGSNKFSSNDNQQEVK